MVKQLQFKLMLLLCALVAGVSSAFADTKVLNFDMSSNPGSWPTTNSTTVTNYTYTLDEVDYTFALKNVKCNAGYLMMTQTAVLGLPAIEGYKLTKVVASNSGGCSTSTQVGISSSSSNATYITGGNYQTWSTTSSSYTYNLTSTEGNTMYYLYVTNKNAQITQLVLTYEETGGSNLTPSDLAITGAPVALSFDLYNNSSAQTVNFTTSSTGAVSVSGGAGYVTTSLNGNTITVTPVAVTPSAQTITISQDADDTYEAGSVTFTVNITDSTPFEGGDVTFDATQDVGTNSSGSGAIKKKVVTVSCSSSNLSDETAYRLYSGSTTTISTTQGTISKIVFTGSDTSYPISRLSTTEGQYIPRDNIGTWTGNATSVDFSASAQARASQIVVTVDMNTKEDPNFSFGETTAFTVNFEEDFDAPELTYAAGFDGTIVYSSSDDNLAIVDEETGEILIGSVEGTVTITATSEATENFYAGSASYTITIVDPAANDGSAEKPYTVAEVQSGKANGKTDVYVTGFIVGSWNNNRFNDEDLVNSNLALADTYDANTSESTIPVELPSGSELQLTWGPLNKSYNNHVAKVILKGNGQNYYGKKAIKGTSVITKVAEYVSISSAGMATYYTDCALDFSGFNDMWAYTATVSGNAITFTGIDKVPAETGILLYNDNETAASNLVPITTEPETVVGNAFVGTLESTTISGEGIYILNNGSNGVGFYKANTNGSTVAPHRAYLNAAGANVRSFIGFSEGEGVATGIETIDNNKQSLEFYNLQGVRVKKPNNGLYIMNGKKVIFK